MKKLSGGESALLHLATANALGQSGLTSERVANALAPVIAEMLNDARIAAWEEGFDAGEQDILQHEEDNFDESTPCVPNPYKEEDQ